MMQSQRRRIWMPAVLAVLVASSGCASRGYVRSQVDETSETLQARIGANTESIERTGQDLVNLELETTEQAQIQAEEITRTQEMIQTTAAEVDQVRTMATSNQTLARNADEQARTVARMFEDRSRFQVANSWEIYFPFSSAEITAEHAEILQAAGEMLRSDPDSILVLEGRTDSTGDPAFNTRLGQQRVDSARGYLILELGVPIHRIHGFSYGEARPEYDNAVLDERQKNRSVKLVVLGPGAPSLATALPE